jgi:SRSO17 transposase
LAASFDDHLNSLPSIHTPSAVVPGSGHVPDVLSIPAEDMLANAKWRIISWRTGTKGKLKARFTDVRVRVADGPPQRIRDKGQQHLPGDEAWLIGEHKMSGEKKYYLANLPAKTELRTLAATIKARWICEQAHQQMKEERSVFRKRRATPIDTGAGS